MPRRGKCCVSDGIPTPRRARGYGPRSWRGTCAPFSRQDFPLSHTYFGGEAHVPVRVIVKDADRIDVARLARNPLSVRDSTYIQLAGLADFSIEDSPPGIERYNQQYKRYIRVYYMGSPVAGPELVRSELESMPLPPRLPV